MPDDERCRQVGFYRELFGIAGKEEDPVHQVILSQGTGLTVYNDGTNKNNQNQNISLAFTVEDVDKEYERLKRMGATIVQAPQTRPWGARNLCFCDPDGNHIYFRSIPESKEFSEKRG